MHFNADASNTELLFRIIHSVNQFSIHGAVTIWCKQFGLTEEEKGQKKTKRIRYQRRVDMCEITRSKTFGIFSKTSSWKQFAGKHSGLRIADRDNSIHKGWRTCIVPAQGISRYELQNPTWRGRRFWADHSIMPRIHAFSSEPTIQSLCSNSWRNNYWTSHWSSNRDHY